MSLTLQALYWTLGKLRAVPAVVWLFLACLSAAAAHVHHDGVVVARARATVRDSILASVRFDSSLIAMTAREAGLATTTTDSVRTVVRWRVARIDSQAIIAAALAASVPAPARVDPVIDSLVKLVPVLQVGITTLRHDVDSLTTVIDRERAARQMNERVLVAQVTAARLDGVREHDARVVLERRPTRKAAVAWSMVSAGVAVGVRELVRAVRP